MPSIDRHHLVDMSTPPVHSHRTAIRSAMAILAVVAVVLTALTSCGGSDTNISSSGNLSGSGIGSGGTGSYTVGSITGFGSIIVNDVRYSYTDDIVTSLDGDAPGSFQLGMVVEVQGQPTTINPGTEGATTRSQAQRILVGSELLGPVGTVNAGTGSFTVLGQTVQTSVDTFYDDGNTARLSGIGGKMCPHVKVYGFLRSAELGHGYDATRVECVSTPPRTYRIRGVVGRVDTGSIEIGGTTFALARGVMPPQLGKTVRAEVNAASNSLTWTVVRLRSDQRVTPATGEARIEGLVSNHSSTDGSGNLVINGVPVLVSDSTEFKGVNRAALSNGLGVSVIGPIVNGTLMATRIESEGAWGSPDFGGGRPGTRAIELHGTGVDVRMLDTHTGSFLFRGVRVSYTPEVIQGDTSASLVSAVTLSIRGVRAPNGFGIVATAIDVGAP